VQAKVQSFSALYMEVTLPENVIILTPETSNIDPMWGEIGITDPAAEKKTMQEMGVQAVLYDPTTAATVRVMSKHNSDSDEVYNLSLLSEDELTAYLDKIFATTDENTTYTIEKYEHSELPFYRLDLHLSKEGTEYSEVVYGTIANGYSISYDIYEKNNTEPLDESFIKEVVSGTHFTDFLDKAEVERQQRKALTNLIIVVCGFLVLLVAFFVLRSRSRKKENLKKKVKTEALSRFFTAQRQNEEQNIKDTPIFSNRTKYSEDLIKTFYTYDRVWKRLKLWIATVAILLLLIASFYSTGSIYVCIIAVGVAAVFVYQYYSQTEKAILREVKAYKSSKNSEALFTFYEDYYTLSGIQSSSKYPYIQVTEIKEYKEYIYIYLGSERAHYLAKDGFEHGLEEFKSFMSGKVNTK
jgi:NADH:ubiquinone oxidoreductase subunit 6 (subunit J)